MKRSFLLAAVLGAVLLSAGCSHIPFFSKKKDKSQPKASSKVATDTEMDFRQRWITKRSGELVSQGVTPAAAQAQALEEFRQKFSSTHAAQMP